MHAHISLANVDRYVGVYFLLICYLNCFYAFADLLSLHLVTFFVTFFSSRCMLELRFAIYHRAASLSSQAFYAVLAEESLHDQTRLSSNIPCTPTVFVNQ